MAVIGGTRLAYPQRAQEAGFCAAITKTGPRSLLSGSLDSLLPLVEQASIAWVDYVTEHAERDAFEIAGKLGFSESLVKGLLSKQVSGYEDFDDEMGLRLPVFSVKGFAITVDPLLIFLRENLIVTLHVQDSNRFSDMRRYAETYLSKSSTGADSRDCLTLILVRVLEENNIKNFEQLKDIDEGSADLTRDLEDETSERRHVGEQIHQMKLALIGYLSGLWATLDTISSLRHGDAKLISDNPRILENFRSLVAGINSQMGLAEHLAEVLASGLECLQSIYNNQLQDKNNQLQEYNNQLQEKNNQLQDTNNQLQEVNNQLQETNNQLQDYNNQLQSKNNQLAEHNNRLQEFNNRLQDFNNDLTNSNNQLTSTNNRLTLLGGWLAILAAGFVVPNTIATVLSQTNIFLFGPLDVGWYIGLVLVSTVVTSIIVWLWVKKRGFLPKIEKYTAKDKPVGP